jgi:hypothetical protein
MYAGRPKKNSPEDGTENVEMTNIPASSPQST